MEDLSVTYSDSDEVYLRKVGGSLERSINQFRPEFLIYNAGTDCLINDPLGCLGISSQGIIDRDELVFEHCLRQKIPVVMLMSGGYQQSNAQIIADSIENLLTKFNLLKEEK